MQFILVEKKIEVAGVESFIFNPAEPLVWKPGQYAHYRLPHEAADERGVERWFTIASAPYEHKVMITTRLTAERGSSFKKALLALKVGDTIESDYVDGDFTAEDPAQEYVFVAGGIGITPFHSILKEADHAQVQLHATLIYANRDANVPYKSELEAFQKNNPHLVVHYLTAPERIDEQVIKKFVPELTKPIFYLSGPEAMVKSLAEVIKAMGVAENKIKLDDFPGYLAE